MALVNSRSPLTVLAPFELFSNAPAQTSIEHIRIEEVRPISQLNTGGYLEFDVNSNLNEYIQLEDVSLYIKFRVNLSKTDGNAISLTDWDDVSMINNTIHSMFSQVDLSINDIQTTISLLTYAHKAYFENLLYSSTEERNTRLEGAGFFVDDEATHYNRNLSSIRQNLISHKAYSDYLENKKKSSTTPLPTNVVNPGIGKICEFSDKVHLDFLNQYKYLIGGTKLRFKFVLNKPEFLFITKNARLYPQIEILDVYLNVPKAIVSDDLTVAHNKAISISPAKYPIDRFEVRTHTIDKGVTGKNIENCIVGQIPKKIFVTFVENLAFNGSFTENPYLYKNFGLTSIVCFVNGRRLSFQPDFDLGLVTKEYLQLCHTLNHTNAVYRMGISKRNFEFGSTIYAFNLCQDGSDGYPTSGHVNPPVDGVVRFEITFKTATSHTLNAIFFCDFDNQISITAERNPIVDY